MSQAPYTHVLITSRAFFEDPPGGPGVQAWGIMSRCTKFSARRRSSDITCGARFSLAPAPGEIFFPDCTAAEEAPMTSHRRARSMTGSCAWKACVPVA